MRNKISSRFIRYFFVVSIAFFVDLLIFNIFYNFTKLITISNLFAFLLGNTIATLLLQFYVFKIKKISQLKQFYYSILLSFLIFFISTLSLKILVEFFGINVMISKITTLIESFLLNFLIRNIYYIRNSSSK